MKKFLLLMIAAALAAGVMACGAFGADSTPFVIRIDPSGEDDPYSTPPVFSDIYNALSYADNGDEDEDGNAIGPYPSVALELAGDFTGDIAFSAPIDFADFTQFTNIAIRGNGHTIAINSDADADTRHFTLNAAIEFTLENVILDGAGIGGGIDVQDGTLYINSGAIFRNNTNSASGGAISVTGGFVSINNGSALSANSSAVSGGAVSVTGGSLYISGGSFSGNTTSADGGAVSISGGICRAIEGEPSFTGNYASGNGGAISITGGTIIVIDTPSFTGNRAENYGGALYYSYSASVSVSGAAFDDTSGANSAPYGGALAVAGGSVSLTDCSFSANSADLYGGAVYIASGTLGALSGNSFTQNKAVYGGAIALADTSSATLAVSSYGLTIGSASSGQGNTAQFGGGLYLPTSAALSTSGTLTISGNTATLGGGLYADSVTQFNAVPTPLTFSGNTADYGGGLYIAATRASTLMLDATRTLTFSGNTAHYDGGAVSTLTADVNIDGITVADKNTAEHAGGFVHSGGTITVTNAAISKQTALLGGAIYAEGTLTVTGSSFDQNISTGIDREQGGGAIFVSGDAVIDTTTFINNRHTNSGSSPNGGGAVYVNRGTLTLTNSTFTGNQASGGSASRGGAVYANISEVSVTNCLLQNNAASGNGGAFAFAGLCSTTITGSTYAENSSAENGGAVYAQGSLAFSTSYFYLNRASGNGGAVYYNQHNDSTMIGSVSAASSLFSQNSAGAGASSGNGGGMYLAPDTATIDRCTFDTNQSSASGADNCKGGGIYIDTSTKTATASQSVIKNSVFWANAVSNGTTNYGGGIYSLGNVALIMNTLVNNDAPDKGGALYADSGTVTVTANIFVGNSSSVGRDVYAEGTITSRGYNRVGIYGKGSDTSWRDDVTGAKPNDWENSEWTAVTFFGGSDGTADIGLVSSYQSMTAPTIGSTLYPETVYLLALVLDEISTLSEQYRATNIIPYAQRFTLGIEQYDIWGTDRFSGGLDITIGAYFSGNGSSSGTTAEKYDIASITMSGIPNTLKYPGQTASLIAMVRYTNGRTSYGVPYDTDLSTMSEGQERVTWTSSNSACVNIDKNGNITALRETSATNGVQITVTTVRYMPSGEQATASRRVIVTNNNGYDYMNISPAYWTYFTENFLPNVFEYDISAAIADKNPSTVKSSVFQRNFSGVWSGVTASQITDLTASTPEFSASVYAPSVQGKSASKLAGISMNYQDRNTGDLFAMTYSWTFSGAETKEILGYDLTDKNVSAALAGSVFDELSVYFAGTSGTIPVLGSAGVGGSEAYEAGALELAKADGGAGLHVELTVYLGNMAVTGNADGAQIVKSSGTNRLLVVPDGADDGAIAGAMWMYQSSGNSSAPSTDSNTNTNQNTNSNTNTNTNANSGSSGGGGGGCNSFGMGLLGAVILFMKRKH